MIANVFLLLALIMAAGDVEFIHKYNESVLKERVHNESVLKEMVHNASLPDLGEAIEDCPWIQPNATAFLSALWNEALVCMDWFISSSSSAISSFYPVVCRQVFHPTVIVCFVMLNACFIVLCVLLRAVISLTEQNHHLSKEIMILKAQSESKRGSTQDRLSFAIEDLQRQVQSLREEKQSLEEYTRGEFANMKSEKGPMCDVDTQAIRTEYYSMIDHIKYYDIQPLHTRMDALEYYGVKSLNKRMDAIEEKFRQFRRYTVNTLLDDHHKRNNVNESP